MNFWQNLPKPIIGLSPMDGVTDAAFRYITVRHGKPAVSITEFISAEGVAAGAVRLLDDFLYSEIERPVVAQIFGSNPDAFFKAAVVACALGFNGLDINMGCPARNISEHGGGAALIKTPRLAQELIRSAKAGVRAWADGITLEQAGVHPAIIAALNFTKHKLHKTQTISNTFARVCEVCACLCFPRRAIPVSVKTRIGYDTAIIEEWVKYLLETEPVTISIHGRTLKQLYSGYADWEAIARATEIIKKTDALVLGNGDVASLADAHEKISRYGVNGVLIGRASFGNPWVFRGTLATHEEKLRVAIEHAQYFERVLPDKNFLHMRKHLGWYISGFDGAKELRMRLMHSSVKCAADVKNILSSWLAAPAFSTALHGVYAKSVI